MPTAGKAPCYGLLSTGRSRHAIPGAVLPFAVILTAHRLRLTLRPARQTAQTFVNHSYSHVSSVWLRSVGAKLAKPNVYRVAIALLLLAWFATCGRSYRWMN